jgi:hypothetical protein
VLERPIRQVRRLLTLASNDAALDTTDRSDAQGGEDQPSDQDRDHSLDE